MPPGRIVESKDVEFEKRHMEPDALIEKVPFEKRLHDYLASHGLECHQNRKGELEISGDWYSVTHARGGLEEFVSRQANAAIVYEDDIFTIGRPEDATESATFFEYVIQEAKRHHVQFYYLTRYSGFNRDGEDG